VKGSERPDEPPLTGSWRAERCHLLLLGGREAMRDW
jgi:hypothetical protein